MGKSQPSPNRKKAPTESQILNALLTVIDPEIGINIVDLGLVYAVEVSEEGVDVDFTLTYPGCPLGDVIQSDIIRAVSEVSSVPVGARLVWNPPWHEGRMSEEARFSLGYPI
ncbi:MAG: metal-sulfur cluster assembly factor [Spirochaetales bacterium]|nr:metal-sulfur cluster assembly factor [Spirochaetales bacterium]